MAQDLDPGSWTSSPVGSPHIALGSSPPSSNRPHTPYDLAGPQAGSAGGSGGFPKLSSRLRGSFRERSGSYNGGEVACGALAGGSAFQLNISGGFGGGFGSNSGRLQTLAHGGNATTGTGTYLGSESVAWTGAGAGAVAGAAAAHGGATRAAVLGHPDPRHSSMRSSVSSGFDLLSLPSKPHVPGASAAAFHKGAPGQVPPSEGLFNTRVLDSLSSFIKKSGSSSSPQHLLPHQISTRKV